jgi:hypothetical protein
MGKLVGGALLVLSLGAWPEFLLAAEPSCTGTLSGSVTGSFTCAVAVTRGEGNAVYLVITATSKVDGVPSLVPGSFEVTGLLQPGTYGLDRLGMGKAAVAADGGTLYTATRTTGQRGEVTLVLSTARNRGTAAGGWEVHGTYRARLLPAGGGKSGEVVVDVKF